MTTLLVIKKLIKIEFHSILENSVIPFLWSFINKLGKIPNYYRWLYNVLTETSDFNSSLFNDLNLFLEYLHISLTADWLRGKNWGINKDFVLSSQCFLTVPHLFNHFLWSSVARMLLSNKDLINSNDLSYLQGSKWLHEPVWFANSTKQGSKKSWRTAMWTQNCPLAKGFYPRMDHSWHTEYPHKL